MQNNKKFKDLTPEEIKRQVVSNQDDSGSSGLCSGVIVCHDGNSGSCSGTDGCTLYVDQIGGKVYASKLVCRNGSLSTELTCNNSGIEGDREIENSGIATNIYDACSGPNAMANGPCTWSEYGSINHGICKRDHNDPKYRLYCEKL